MSESFMWIELNCRKILQFERCGLNQGVGKFLRFEKSESFELHKL